MAIEAVHGKIIKKHHKEGLVVCEMKKSKVVLDIDENTSEEERKVNSRKRKAQGKAQVEEDMDPALLFLQSLGTAMNEEEEAVNEEPQQTDPFTCFVQYVVATTLFPDAVELGPPDAVLDDPALFADKLLFRSAAQGYSQFIDETLTPLLQRIKAKQAVQPELIQLLETHANMTYKGYAMTFGGGIAHHTVTTAPQLAACRSLHTLFHLNKYISKLTIECAPQLNMLDSNSCVRTNLSGAWELLATPANATTPISEWVAHPQNNAFVDKVIKMQRIVKMGVNSL